MPPYVGQHDRDNTGKTVSLRDAKVFVTGSTGYIGNLLTKKLLKSDCRVTALCRKNTDAFPPHKNLQIVPGTLDDEELMTKSMKNCDLVFHLAAFARVWSPDKDEYWKINVRGTERVLNAAGKAGVKKVVFTSTGGVFGPGKSQHDVVSESSIRSAPFFNLYEKTKSDAENLCLRYNANGLPVVIVNPTRVYGYGIETSSNAVTKLIRMIKSGKWRFIPGDGTKVGNYAFVDDVVEGHILAMLHGRPGERYILGGENCSYHDLLNMIRSMCRPDLKLYKLPLPLITTFAGIEELKAKLFRIPPLITSEWAKKYLYDWPLTSAKAEKELGYKITPLRSGLTITIEKMNHKL